MLRRILRFLRRPRSPKIVVVPGRVIKLEKAGVRLACDAEVEGAAVEPSGLEGLASEELTRICDDYWDYLACRPRFEEIKDLVKERQAIDAAIMAIGKLGRPSGIAVLRGVLFSTQWYHDGDTKWVAAEALGKLAGQSFTEGTVPVRSAQGWLSQHPVHN